MDVVVPPPVAPMLARLARTLPDEEGLVFEPKWDGFRAVVFRAGDAVEIRSRNDRPLDRYFPELVDDLRALPCERFVLDGEILVSGPGGYDFEALMLRLHPAPTRVARLMEETPATFIAFDALAVDDDDLRQRPFRERRDRLARLVEGSADAVVLTPATTDRRVAENWLRGHRGIDGVVAKDPQGRYESGRRAMVKVKVERTADCIAAGFRLVPGEPGVASLLLGLYDDGSVLRHVGVVASFRHDERAALATRLAPLVVPLSSHPWARGFGLGPSPTGRLKGSAGRWTPDMGLDWVPIAPELVCEVSYDHVEHGRFRHPARLRRWRPDRDPASCTFEQLPVAGGIASDGVNAGGRE